MSNKESLIEFILKLSDEEAKLILSRLKNEEEEKLRKKEELLKYHSTIYSIKHNVTGREYIGRTKNFEERIKIHMSALRSGRHIIEDMQADYDEYGNDYTITVLEEINDYAKNHREYDLMEEHKSYIRGIGYNYKDLIFKKKKGLSYESKHRKN